MDYEGHKGLKRELLKNTFYRFLTLSIGKIGGIVFIILLARFLQPELFGIYSLSITIIILIGSIFNQGIDVTLLRYVSNELSKKNNKKARSYFRFLLHLKIIVMLFISVIMFLTASFFSFLFHKPIISALKIGSFFLFFETILNFFVYFIYAVKKVEYEAIKEVFYNISRILLLILFVQLLGMKVEGAILSLIGACIVSVGFLGFVLYKKYYFLIRGDVENIDKKRIFKFMFYVSLSAFSTIFFAHVDTLMIGSLLPDAKYVGFYTSSFNIISALIGLIVLAQIIIPAFTELHGLKFERAFKKIFYYMLVIGFPIAFGLISIGGVIIKIIYGESYLPAAQVLYFLSFLTILASGDLFSIAFYAKEKSKYPAVILIYSLFINIFLNYLLIISFSRLGTEKGIIGAAIATLISRSVYFVLLMKKAKKELNIRLEYYMFYKPFFASIVMFIGLYLLKKIINLVWPWSILEIITGAIIYFVVMISIRGLTKEDLKLLISLIKK